jgi:hypothetical protein
MFRPRAFQSPVWGRTVRSSRSQFCSKSESPPGSPHQWQEKEATIKENTETRHAQQIQFGLIEQFLEVEELDCKLAVQEVGMHTENSYQWRTTHSFGRSAIQSCRWLMLGLIFFTLGISANATPIAITPTGEGRYLPGLFDQVGSVLVGQGQAGWHGFDTSMSRN